MPRRPPVVVLDACVLANQTAADLLLRLAEDPALLRPRWSEEILAEVRRTHRKLGWPDSLAESWQTDVSACFPEAAFDAPPGLIPRLRNQAKDRHVSEPPSPAKPRPSSRSTYGTSRQSPSPFGTSRQSTRMHSSSKSCGEIRWKPSRRSKAWSAAMGLRRLRRS